MCMEQAQKTGRGGGGGLAKSLRHTRDLVVLNADNCFHQSAPGFSLESTCTRAFNICDLGDLPLQVCVGGKDNLHLQLDALFFPMCRALPQGFNIWIMVAAHFALCPCDCNFWRVS